MLILSRRIGEKLVIGEGVFFTVLGIKGNQVRLGIDAPADVSVHREEIFLKVKSAHESQKKNGVLNVTLTDTFRAHKDINSARQLAH